MPTYAVTGATGQLGRLVITQLLEAGVRADEVVAVVRSVTKAADLAERGVVVRVADYDQPETLPPALEGVDTLLLISASEPGRRVAQHAAAVAAAVASGVSRVVYTSVLRADTTELVLAPEHRATEEMLRSSGLTFTLLRNGWYVENYTSQVGQYVATGAITNAAGNGRIAGAARADYAAAAVQALVGEGHDNATYELGGPAFTLAELADVITEVTGTTVVDHQVTPAELTAILQEHAGLPAAVAGFVTQLDVDTAAGALDTTSTDLVDLIGRPTTSLEQVVRDAVDALAVVG